MSNILIIDDERYAIEGIVKGIDWEDIGISNVYEARGSSEAMEIISMHDIDVIVCDIEMPGMNGIDLVKWARSNSYDMKIIFLTGHADFPYAQNAIKLNSFDYVLKPVEHEQLKNIIVKALSEKTEETRLRINAGKYDHYYAIWESNRKNLIGSLWIDIINNMYRNEEDELNELFNTYGLNITASAIIRPVLFSIQYNVNMPKGLEHELERIGLQDSAEEIFLKEYDGFAVYLDNRHLCVIFHSAPDMQDIRRKCQEFVQSSYRSFRAHILCYIGKPVETGKLPDMVKELFYLKDNTLSSNAIYEYRDQEIDRIRRDKNEIPIDQWRVLLETEDLQQLQIEIYGFFGKLDANRILPQTIKAFYHTLCAIVYNELQRKRKSITEMPGVNEIIQEGQYINSLEQSRDWSVALLNRINSYLKEKEASFSTILKKVQQYIDENDNQYYSRTEIANLVNLNPDYLSRLFKKETGRSLSSYIIEQKLEKAKALLKNTDKKISDIAEEVGYTHLSHFTNIFKKNVGMTPYEYRKRIY